MLVMSSDLELIYEWFKNHDIDNYDNTLGGFLDWFGDKHKEYDYKNDSEETTESLCSQSLGLNLNRLDDLEQEIHDLWDIYGLDFKL